MIRQYVKGKLNGRAEDYYDDDMPIRYFHYKDDELDGLNITFQLGICKFRRYYKKSKQEGLELIYFNLSQ